jgi:beta-glucosidase
MRTAAAEAIVLLKNTRNLLPLTSIKKIAVIGPNAKEAMTSGGGSAQLLSTYKVSPLEGIAAAAQEIGAQVSYSVGAAVFKYPKLLDPHITLSDGSPGALMEFWNEPPSDDYINVQPDFQQKLKPPVWTTSTKSSNCVLLDGVVSYSLEMTTSCLSSRRTRKSIQIVGIVYVPKYDCRRHAY